MIPNNKFHRLPKDFWAHVKSISQHVGYTERGKDRIKVPTIQEMCEAMKNLSLSSDHLAIDGKTPTKFGTLILEYFQYRSEILDNHVEPNLMDAPEARRLYRQVIAKYKPTAPQPLNKQKGRMRAPAFLTGLVNTLIEANLEGKKCDYSPRELTTVTKNGYPIRTLSRWVDGAFPSPVNPIAVWEIKEYYYTTTFGSRVADGVYETLLDGMELEELYEHERINVKHYLIIDSHYTWWECGRSYLCRIVDMLHMGYVNEVLFGKEVLVRIPEIVKDWVAIGDGKNQRIE